MSVLFDLILLISVAMIALFVVKFVQTNRQVIIVVQSALLIVFNSIRAILSYLKREILRLFYWLKSQFSSSKEFIAIETKLSEGQYPILLSD